MDFLSFMDSYSGPLLAAAFFLLMGYIFYWIIVIVPRRIKEVYNHLELKGYRQIDTQDLSLKNILLAQAPAYPVDPITGEDLPDWKCKHAAVKKETSKKRYIINALRGQVDKPGVKNNVTTRDTTILMEKMSLSFKNDVYLVPCDNKSSIRWEKRYGLKKIMSGIDTHLAELFDVYAEPFKTADFPKSLKEALIKVCPIITDRSLFCFQHGVSLRFHPDGWGISTSNQIYKKKDMTMLIQLADVISHAVPPQEKWHRG